MSQTRNNIHAPPQVEPAAQGVFPGRRGGCLRYRDFQDVRFDRKTRRYVDCPTYRGFPLGGIGNGGISIFADGDFSECRTNHSWQVPVRDLRGTFFAIRAEDAQGRKVARLLRRTHHHSRGIRGAEH